MRPIAMDGTEMNLEEESKRQAIMLRSDAMAHL
jgi:hypothetical protein